MKNLLKINRQKKEIKHVTSFAPARVDLSSGAADWCGFSTLSMAVNLFVKVKVSKRNDSKIFLKYEKNQYFFDINKPKKACSFVELVIKKANKIGYNLEFSSDIPRQSGLGGSASLAVAILGAINKLFKLNWSKYELAEIAQRVETHDNESVQGYQDQYTAVFGGALMMDFKYKASKEIKDEPYGTTEQLGNYFAKKIKPYILIVDGNKPHSSKTLNENLQKQYLSGDKEVKKLMLELDNLSREMKTTIVNGNKKRFYEIVNRNQDIMKIFGRSNINCDKIIDTAIKHGANAGKCVGAGNGAVALFFDNYDDLKTSKLSISKLNFVTFIKEVKISKGLLIKKK